MVDGVQADPPASDEGADSLQLPVPHTVLEHHVVGEVHIAGGGFEGLLRRAGLWYRTLLGTTLNPHGLR